MSCCFMFYPFKPMDSSKNDVQSSVAEYLEKEKLCQEICETITKSVEGPQLKGNCTLPIEASSLLPEFNSDEDVEDILQQISDLLGSQLCDNSQCTDIEGVEDLSVDEILKQAEEIVRASTPYFERKTNNCSGVEPLLEPIRRSVKQLAKRSTKRSTKPTAHYPIHQTESSHQEVNKNAKTEVFGSQLDVKNDIFDRNGNSPTPTNDSDDEIFESPVESPEPETPLHKDLSNLRKSCSDSECHLKVTHEVKKSSSVGKCNIQDLLGEKSRLLTEVSADHKDEAKKCGPAKELTLSDLRVSPCFSSKETVSEAISPEEINANGNNRIEEPNAVNEDINLESVRGVNEDLVSPQIIAGTSTAENDGRAEQVEIHGNLEVPTDNPKETVPVEVSNESQKLVVLNESKKAEAAKNAGKFDQKRSNRRANEKNGQLLGAAKHQTLRNAKIIQNAKESTSVNTLKSTSKPTKEDTENLCPNEEHCSVITDLRNQIQSLTSKVSEYEKFEARARKNEMLAAAERQRIKLLQEEVKSQEELIVGYQSENQRLSNDILAAKVG